MEAHHIVYHLCSGTIPARFIIILHHPSTAKTINEWVMRHISTIYAVAPSQRAINKWWARHISTIIAVEPSQRAIDEWGACHISTAYVVAPSQRDSSL